MAFNPILRITDGTTTVNLIESKGWLLDEWKPAIAEPKGGGVFRNSPLTDGRKLAYRKMDNITDTFNLIGSKDTQNEMITSIQELERLLEKATSYWTSNWQNEPVWIEARAANESYSRYATVVDYRLSGFGGPFRQPFFSSDCNSATEAILVIEHTFWQETEPGEEGTCVEVSSTYTSPAIVTYTTDTFYPVESASDATYSNALPTVDLDGLTVSVGYSDDYTGDCISGIVFDNVTIAKGARVEKATLTINVDEFYAPASLVYPLIIVSVQEPQLGGASVFDGTVSDFMNGINMTSVSNKIFTHITIGTGEKIIDVTQLVQHAVNSQNWSSGDDLRMFISSRDASHGFDIFSFDNGSDYPELYVEHSPTELTLGCSSTCLHESMVSNKQNRGVITHVFIYDDGTATYSANLIEEALPYDLLPANPAAGDYICFGSDSVVSEGYGPFCSIVFDLSTVADGITGKWQFYSDWINNWDDFDNTICGDAHNFNTAGVCSVVFEPTVKQDDNHTENGVSGYWVRYLVTAVDTPTPPEQHNRQIYTVVNPYIDIDSLQIPGDIPALARILFDPAACSDWSATNTVVIGLRSLSRGEDFAAYLNVSDVQNPVGIIFENDSSVSFAENGGTITGRVLFMSGYVPTEGEWNNFCSWTISGDLAKQYLGEYHAYIRGMFNSGHRSNTKLRLRAVFGDEFNTSYSDISGIMAPSAYEEEIIDVGKLSIQPSQTLRPRDNIDFIKIYLDIYMEDVFTLGLEFIMDIILIPSDEWIGCFSVPIDSPMYYGKGIDVDGITNPRQYRASETTINGIPDGSGIFEEDDRSITAEMSRVSSSEPIFQANKDQRLWFTQYFVESFVGGIGSIYTHQNCGKVCAQRSARYIYARGSR